ncbi:CoA-transferase [Alicyclobacillus shizuokensis]|uniref:CoA-transferase n=1 Tax=Alicyclobacillus shizuokensis TaxID=392014 RepID=UPI00082C0382|nr:CoA-transferase [Alicyclobacillus shizuokensis]
MPLDERYALDEFLITTMARQFSGEVMVSSVTAFGALSALLAKARYAPDLAVLATPESGMEVTPMPTLSLGQFLTDAQRGIPLTMEEIFDAIFTDRFRIWINPAQIDRHGNTNISVIGDWHQPKVAMVGSRGIPEDTSHLSQIFYYVLTHSRRTVVEQVDFRSGAGTGPDRDATLGEHGAPSVLVTDLGVFDFTGPDGTMAVRSLHPGVTLEEVQEKSGFEIHAPSSIPVTEPPTEEDVQIIRDADPLEVRKLELLSGPEAAERFVSIYERERQALHAAWPRLGKLG